MTTTASLAKLRELGTYIGMDLGIEQHPITDDRVRWYIATIGDDHPWYRGPSPFGGPVAPALLYHNPAYGGQTEGVAVRRSERWYLPNRYGNLHAKQQWEFFRPALVGETLRSQGLVIDRYFKRDREFVTAEAWLLDPQNRVVSRVRSTQSFLADPSVTGVVVDRDREKRPGRTFEMSPGEVLEELSGRRVLVTPEMCDRFTGERRNYHNDLTEAEKLGFKEIVVQGTLSTCFLAELMTRRFGEGFFLGGRLAMTFVNVLWAGEAVTPKGLVRSRTREGNLWRVTADLWTEKDDGTRTIVATASALEA
jgi:acyl dehydratase